MNKEVSNDQISNQQISGDASGQTPHLISQCLNDQVYTTRIKETLKKELAVNSLYSRKNAPAPVAQAGRRRRCV